MPELLRSMCGVVERAIASMPTVQGEKCDDLANAKKRLKAIPEEKKEAGWGTHEL